MIAGIGPRRRSERCTLVDSDTIDYDRRDPTIHTRLWEMSLLKRRTDMGLSGGPTGIKAPACHL
jgi:hypothetical protein